MKISSSEVHPVRILPVIDLLDGQVVRGVAGRRQEYRPVQSILCEGARPLVVANALARKLGLSDLYLADLDAIQGNSPNWDLYRQLLLAGHQLWIDAGLKDASCCKAMVRFTEKEPSLSGSKRISIIAGLETLASPAVLQEMLTTAGPERLVFSLDLKNGVPLSESPAWKNLTPEAIVDTAVLLGVKRFIVLDLARVGVGSGVGTESLCQYVRQQSPEAEIVSGGGVRGIDDLQALAQLGCDGVLVASALHDGRVGLKECQAITG